MPLNLQSFVQNGSLLFTVSSDGYKFLTWNLYLHLQKINPSLRLLILCLDKESNDFFNRIAMIPSRLYIMDGPTVQHKSPTVFGSTPFKRMNRMKLRALQELSQRLEIETLLYLDSDIAVFQDPLVSIQSFLQEAPLWFQCDESGEHKYECSNTKGCPNACTGVIAMKVNEETRPLFQTLYTLDEDWKKAVTDQDYINDRMKKLGVSFQTLPRFAFPNGVFLSENRFQQRNPVLLHFNYITGNDKKRMMKNKDCWLLTDY